MIQYRKVVSYMRVLRPATTPINNQSTGKIMKSVPGNLK
jgi:hypothetical protein